jgi:hypothetical protein
MSDTYKKPFKAKVSFVFFQPLLSVFEMKGIWSNESNLVLRTCKQMHIMRCYVNLAAASEIHVS